MFQCITSQRSTKSLVPPLHKFTIQKLNLRKVQWELLGNYFHCTLGWLHPQASTASFRLIALWNRVKYQCYKEANIPPCYLKNATKNNIKFCNVLSQIDFIQYKFDHQKQYFIRESRSKHALNYRDISGIALKTFWLALLIFLLGWSLSRIPLRSVLISV